MYGQHPDGSWEGCDTISVFAFTGAPPQGLVRDNANRTLCELGAEDIETPALAASLIPGVTAVRNSGYVTVASRRVWAQYSTYVAGSEAPGQGMLIEHSLFIESSRRARLTDDITWFSNAVQRAFLTGIESR